MMTNAQAALIAAASHIPADDAYRGHPLHRVQDITDLAFVFEKHLDKRDAELKAEYDSKPWPPPPTGSAGYFEGGEYL